MARATIRRLARRSGSAEQKRGASGATSRSGFDQRREGYPSGVARCFGMQGMGPFSENRNRYAKAVCGSALANGCATAAPQYHDGSNTGGSAHEAWTPLTSFRTPQH